MFHSLRARLWLSYFLLIAVILAVIGVSLFIYLVRNPLVYRQTALHLHIAEAAIALQLAPSAGLSPQELQQAVQRQDQVLKVRVIVLGPDGSVLADSRGGSGPELRRMQLPYKFPGENQALAVRDKNGTVWMYTLRALDGGDFLMVTLPRPRIQLAALLRDEFGLLITRAGALALVLALILGLLMARWISAPLQRMAAGARGVAAGNYHPIPPEGPQEVQELARAFNEMAGRVQASQQSQRDFLANVSHELKTPITSIQGFAQAILDGAANTPEALQGAAGVIFSEAGRMARLVKDLLTLSRLETGTAELERQPLDLAALAAAVGEKMRPQAQAAQVDLQVAAGPPLNVTGDEDRLAQVFTNLIDNALKFTPAGGRVEVAARAQDGWALVEVCDTGPGLSPEEQGRIFERFYQADRSRRGGDGRGVGLGLAIARQIVQAHGGTIEVRSQPGQGSTFSVRLPAGKG